MSQEFTSTLLLVVAALFPVINPPAAGFIILSLVPDATPAQRARLARRITVNSFLLLLGALSVGAYVLSFFGVSIPVLRLAGGLVIGSTAGSSRTHRTTRRRPTPCRRKEPRPRRASVLPADLANYGRPRIDRGGNCTGDRIARQGADGIPLRPARGCAIVVRQHLPVRAVRGCGRALVGAVGRASRCGCSRSSCSVSASRSSGWGCQNSSVAGRPDCPRAPKAPPPCSLPSSRPRCADALGLLFRSSA